MKHPLRRLLQLRALLQEQSHLDLARRSAELRRLETMAGELRKKARAVRGDAVRQLIAGGADWLLEIADAEILGWKGARLRSEAESRRPDVEAARSALLERRVERRQVEALVTEGAMAEALDEARREQKRIDDWFQSRTARDKSGR